VRTAPGLRGRLGLAVLIVRSRARGILLTAACLVLLFGVAWIIGAGQGEH
jgi:hypothetical protein